MAKKHVRSADKHVKRTKASKNLKANRSLQMALKGQEGGKDTPVLDAVYNNQDEEAAVYNNEGVYNNEDVVEPAFYNNEGVYNNDDAVYNNGADEPNL